MGPDIGPCVASDEVERRAAVSFVVAATLVTELPSPMLIKKENGSLLLGIKPTLHNYLP
jgi:hypothetical protein